MKILSEYEIGPLDEYEGCQDVLCGMCPFIKDSKEGCTCGVSGEEIIYYDGYHRARRCYLDEFQAKEMEILRQIEVLTRDFEMVLYTAPHEFTRRVQELTELRKELEEQRSWMEFNVEDDLEPNYDFSKKEDSDGTKPSPHRED